MAEDELVSFRLEIPRELRQRFKVEAYRLGLDVNELGPVALDYVSEALACGVAPQRLREKIEKAKTEVIGKEDALIDLLACLKERVADFWGDWPEKYRESFRRDYADSNHPILKAEAAIAKAEGKNP
jgi:hypothetical protein